MDIRLAFVAVLAACGSPAPLVDGGGRARVGPIELAAVGGETPAPPPGDAAWAPLEEGVSLQRRLVHWLRAPVELVGEPDASHPLGLAVAMLAAYELYWDGAPIARSGRVGASRELEQPGPVDGTYVLPATPRGPHLVTMRLSNFHYDGNLSNVFYRFHIADYAELLGDDVRARFAPMLALGWLVVAAVLLLAVYITQGRRPSALLFAAICVLVAAAVLGQSWRWLVGYTYDHHVLRLRIVTAASAAAAALLPIAFAYELEARRRWLAAGAGAVAAVAAVVGPWGYNVKVTCALFACVVVSIAIAAAAAVRRRRGARLALGGVVLCLAPVVVNPYRYHDAGFVAGFSALLVALLFLVGMRVRDERREAGLTRLRSARLELELLKRGIQPHYLMNALTSILEWIEQAPARAARFVEALADELRLLSRVSTQRLIPIELELELCRAHVALMSQRLELELSLRASGIEIADCVPPALFHTLIENAIKHGRFAREPTALALDADRTGARRRYRLVSPELEPSPALGEGTGLRYVRARLTESYGDRWHLRSGPTAAGWETVIEIEDA